MYRPIKTILIFEIGLLLGIFVIAPKQTPKVLPISSHLPEISFPKEENSISIIFTGDVMLGRSVDTRIRKYHDPKWPFKNISDLLSSSDLTIINLESPFRSGCRPTDTGMTFCADPQNVAGLVAAGIDYASLANNHINNQGDIGLEETITTLKNNGITPTGLNKPVFTNIKNTSLAILSFSDLPQIEDKLVKNQIEEAASVAELTIATFHWGNEYQAEPTVRQINLAHLAIESGADIVVGHHPHWTQTEEYYQGKPIYYSLGNLVFDQMWSEETRLGHILKVVFEKDTLIKNEIIPIKIYDYGQPALN